MAKKGRDQFGLDKTMGAAGRKRLSEQPKASRSVPGAEAPSGNRGARPSDSRAVPGAKIQGSKS